MDSYEATRVVFSRIQHIDPENASKIMGLLLIQDHGEKEMIRLAFGPETLVHSVIFKARKDLGLTSNNSPPSSPSPFLSTNPIAISRQPFITIPNNPSLDQQQQQSPEDHHNLISSNPTSSSSSSSSLSSSSLPFYQNGTSSITTDHSTTMDEFQLQDQLSFLNDTSSPPLGPKGAQDSLFFTGQDNHLLLSSSPSNDAVCFPGSPYWPSASPTIHRRSCSVSDMCLAAEDPTSGLGWKPCLYFARGFCKNGTSCRFLHGNDESVQLVNVGSPNANNNKKLDSIMIDHHHNHNHNHNHHHHHHHELLRSKSLQQQRLVSVTSSSSSSSSSPTSNQLMANSFPYSPKCINFLLQQQFNESQRAVASASMIGCEDLHKFGRTRLERSDFAMNGCVNPASRQIYLTFPADSTFREEDVSNYFSIYGPVQDVRIPYQQKRMFGFVTFVYPETVKLILAKGNPHFVCDARVLVKPYKEKGKVQDKYRKQQQSQMERGDFSPCGTPTGLDSRDPFDLQLGARMFYNSQDMLWRRKLEEQAELQQAIELQSRRLMSLQLLDVKKQHHRALSTGSPIPSPTQSPNFFSQSLVLSSIQGSSEAPLDQNCSTLNPNPVVITDPPAAIGIGKEPTANHEENGNDKESPHDEIDDLLESLEHNLPDSPFASPTKVGGDYNHMNAFSGNNCVVVPNETNDHSSSDLSSATSSNMSLSTLDMASFKSFNCQLPRFSSGHGAIGMYAGTAGGPKCPVGI